MGRIRYTVSTRITRCPKCGKELDCESQGVLTPVIACLWIFTLPIMIVYTLLHYLAFSCPTQKKIGSKYMHCPNCLEIIKTDNHYVEELYGEGLLNYKFELLFILAYVLGVVLLFTIISFVDGFSIIKLIITLVCLGSLAGIIIPYRVLLPKYQQQTGLSRDAIALIEKKQELEFIELYEELHKTRTPKKQVIDTSFVSTYEERIAKHKKWLSNEREGKQLIVEDEIISNINLQGIRLQNSKFIGCTFKNLDLSNSSFRKSDFSGSSFVGCNLTKTDFTGAILDKAQLKKCNTSDTIFGKQN